MVVVHLYNWAVGADTIPACDHVRLLGVIISADLSLDRHVSVVSSAFFYWLRQLRRVRRSLDDESAAILVHAFVTSRVDYCNLLLVGAPKSVTGKLQRVMNAAAQVVSDTKKYDHGLTHLLHSQLHWFDVADRVTYKLGVTVYKCLHGQAPDYYGQRRRRSMTVDDCYRTTITRDGATVAGSSQLPVRRHFSPEIYLLLINSETTPEYVESTR